jgi:carbon storage regulator CsrA
MLILSRKNQEAVVIGNGPHQLLRVTVLQALDGCVKLGFEAHADCAIDRWEAWERICAVTDLANARMQSRAAIRL